VRIRGEDERSVLVGYGGPGRERRSGFAGDLGGGLFDAETRRRGDAEENAEFPMMFEIRSKQGAKKKRKRQSKPSVPRMNLVLK